ncbi:uncharacterized protein LOC110449979 [Mizuhopecten yessoensis]|uniref:Uncharacterized protein n=1 Tax=Mizuhopecten yessoensis TaxID=6573 RepID=A0A210QQ21_MIZYE|nr:uncharacterized protein LOC110449979 [Mizuhopecten yessoensis]OWF50819.1 hypothetical protein KP79_PYT09540 [Mizuhopecten yessoensis]
MEEALPAIPALLGPGLDPSRDFISSERYLQSLERKLNKVQGKKDQEANSKDIIKSLGKVKDDHMVQMMSESRVSGSPGDDPDQYKGSVVNKNHNSSDLEEVVALVYQDCLAKSHDDESQQEVAEKLTGSDGTKT